MTRLKLCPDVSAETRSEFEPLPFPGSIRDLLAGGSAAIRSDALTRSIDATLDRMQDRLDELRSEMRSVLRFSDFHGSGGAGAAGTGGGGGDDSRPAA